LAQKSRIKISVDPVMGIQPFHCRSIAFRLGFSGDQAKQMMKINLESSEVLDCALGAIGADALFAFSGSTASVWSAAAITKAFSAVAKKFLRPVGVAIAVDSFGLCISHESLD
jgi:hypothetical protein